MNTCFYIAFVIVQPILTSGFKCYRVENSLQYSPTITLQIKNRSNCIDLYRLDLFPCGDHNTFINVECLMCGRKAANFKPSDSLCPNSHDDPVKFLTCSECTQYTRSCQNGGTAYCQNSPSYAEEMQCLCSDGFTGDYCEHRIIKVYRMCRCSGHNSSLDRPLCSDSTADRCRIELLDGNISCICENIRNERPTNMQDCSNINEERSVEDEPSLITDNSGNAGQTQTQTVNRACKGYTWNVFCFVQFVFLLLRVP